MDLTTTGGCLSLRPPEGVLILAQLLYMRTEAVARIKNVSNLLYIKSQVIYDLQTYIIF
jgi:hypothetical protein